VRYTVSAVLASVLCLSFASVTSAQDVKEPRSGVSFAAKDGSSSLLGVGLRTRTMLKVKVYAIGLYVDDAALAGPLAAHKGKTTSPEFYRDLVWGDFGKHVVLKFVRDVSASQIQGAFREVLPAANNARVDPFVSYFGDTKVGQEYVIRWAPGGVLETTVIGVTKPPIADKDFAAAVFSIWLGEKPIQDDIKKDLVARAPELIK
jgi:Chalcone isomerase-like